MNKEIEITFEKSAAPFILEAFSHIDMKCGFCGADIKLGNLGGVVKLEEKAVFICTNTLCLLEFAEKE